jgi:hypothetical protein
VTRSPSTSTPADRGKAGASLFARNRDDTFPHWHGRDLATRNPGLRYHLFAADGDTTETVLDHQLPRLERSGAAPTVATLTVGGNDLLGVYGDTPRARRVIAVVRRRVGQTLRRLRPLMRSPNVPIIVGTVYDPSDGTGDAGRVSCHPGPQSSTSSPRSTPNSRPWPPSMPPTSPTSTDTFSATDSDGGNPAQTHPRPADPNLWYCNVIEPKAWGADGVRAAFWQALHS